MGNHGTPRGEQSTAQHNGKQSSPGQYTGKHREHEMKKGIGFFPHGDRNRDAKGGDYERGQ